MKKIKLFCLPYAGGSATTYLSWKKYLHESIELIPLELSGRGLRFNESLYEDFTEMLTDIYKTLNDSIDGSPYAFYGHSMGSLVSYELCNLVRANNEQMPIHLFLSGRCPPHIAIQPRIKSDMNDDDLKEELKKMGGTPDEIFRYNKVFTIFVNVLRNDLQVIEKYKYNENLNEKLNCPITVFNGKMDILEQDMNEWSSYTTSEFRYYLFEGGHFFINDNITNIANIINSTLLCI